MYILINNIPINVLSDIKRIHEVKKYDDSCFRFRIDLNFSRKIADTDYMASWLFSSEYKTKEEAQEVLDSLLLFINGITSSLNKINI